MTDETTRILVIEDNPVDQELLHRELRKTGYGNNILFLSDPRVALDLLQGIGPGGLRTNLIAIFLDVHLPYMNGLDVLKIIRTSAGMETLPVIVMTSSPHPDTIETCQKLNVLAFVEKPVTLMKFSKAVAEVFHRPPEKSSPPVAIS